MKILSDHEGRAIRLTDERLAHILEHPEMAGREAAVEETLAHPERVVQSFSDPQAHLYYRSLLSKTAFVGCRSPLIWRGFRTGHGGFSSSSPHVLSKTRRMPAWFAPGAAGDPVA